MDITPKTLLEIGKIVGTHGLRGDLKARSSSGDPGLLLEMDHLYVRCASGETCCRKVVRRVAHKGQALLRFEAFDSIDKVEQLVGCSLLVAADALPELGEGEHYWTDLEGMLVIDSARGELGRLSDIFTTAAHDTYVVDGLYGEVLIPAVQQFILSIDYEKRLMRVELPEGLVVEDDEL
jgi:16S rRNA processing protein RimM